MNDSSDEMQKTAAANALVELMNVVEALLAPDGCPWDRKQTPQSLCDYLTEESFELIDAIRENDDFGVLEEIGDVTFLLAFVGILYQRAGKFTLGQSLEAAAAKMVRRHPHVFGEAKFKNIEELWANWEKTKKQEKSEDERPAGTFAGLPRSLPPLLMAYRIHSKAARVGFTWRDDAEFAAHLANERREWEEALASGDPVRMEEEYGDYLFTLVEQGRRLGLKANPALDAANRKFLRRFALMEDMAGQEGRELRDLDFDQMNALWDRAKKIPA